MNARNPNANWSTQIDDSFWWKFVFTFGCQWANIHCNYETQEKHFPLEIVFFSSSRMHLNCCNNSFVPNIFPKVNVKSLCQYIYLLQNGFLLHFVVIRWQKLLLLSFYESMTIHHFRFFLVWHASCEQSIKWNYTERFRFLTLFTWWEIISCGMAGT